MRSIHTYPQRGVAFVDVFSCRPFDTGKAQEFFQEMFKARRMDASEVKRGIHFHEIIGGEW